MTEILNGERGSGNPRAASVRIEGDTQTGYASQRGHDLRRGQLPSYVARDRMNLNAVLMEPLSPSEMRRLAVERRSRKSMKRGMKSNSCVAFAGIITFGSEAAGMFETLDQETQHRAFRIAAYLTARRLGTTLHGLIVHRDESTVHCHFTLCGYTRDGRPLSKTTRPAMMAELQDLMARVMSRFHAGIERGYRYGDRLAAGADFADVLHKSVRQLHRELPADIARKQEHLTSLDQSITDASAILEQARADHQEMLTRVEKLRAREELTEREAKRLATYERRLEDRVTKLADAEAEVERLTAAIRARVEAFTAGTEAIAAELSAGTIGLTDDGRVRLEQVGPIVAAPELMPSVRVVAKMAADIRAAQAEAEVERARVSRDRRNIEADRERNDRRQRGLNLERDAVRRERDELRQMRGRLEVWYRAQRKKFERGLSIVAAFLRRPGVSEDMRQEARTAFDIGSDILERLPDDLPKSPWSDPEPPPEPAGGLGL